ncbi:unnamed protein product [Caenorhabditis angaria]|uniref:G-protein coupled receptors family 1 profile domain-containing protein n=1 Tax=Caenorhabditis angaria TaxID=860376 RepID=A0A9P1IUP2_9PELO|nr:unnamed protein product [Caenorhabditis angaria]
MNNSAMSQAEFLELLEKMRSTYTWLIPLMLMVLLIAILGNGLIVMSSSWLSSPVSPYLKLCVSLAAADMWAAILLSSGLLVNSYLPVVHQIKAGGPCFEAVLEMVRIGGMLTSDMHLFALAINQFLGTMYPLKYKIMVTTRRIRALILCLWFVPQFFVFFWFVLDENDGLRNENCRFNTYNHFKFRITVFLIFMIPLISTLVIYGCILVKLLKAKVEFESVSGNRKMNNLQQTHSYSTRRTTNVYSKLKLVWTTLLIVSTFSLSWGLCVLYFVLVCNDCIVVYRRDIPLSWSLVLSSSVNMLVMLKLALNPFIYTLRIKAIRSSVDHFLNFISRRKPVDQKYSHYSLGVSHSIGKSTIEPTAI